MHPKHDHILDAHHEIYIIGLVLNNPELQLPEIADKLQEISGITVSTATLCRLLAKYGYTQEKIQHIASQRCLDLRGSFVAHISLFPKEILVFVDESGTHLKDMLRQYGYAICGERAICSRLLLRRQQITSIAAICTEGVLAVDMTSETVNRDKFVDFVRGSLIPELLPFDGCNPRSIVVMDNCSIHHVQEVIDLFIDAGILLLYLPPYSPDLNPIELTFSFIKHYLKQHECIAHIVSTTHLLQAAFDAVTSDLCNTWIEHCGY